MELIRDDAPAMRPFSASLPMALLHARETAMRLFRPMLAEYGLTEQQWRVLRALTASKSPLEATELAERTFLLAPSLSRILANLAERGLITRGNHPTDLRRSRISLSEEGQTLVASVAPESERRYNAIEAEFGSNRLARLLAELHDLAALDPVLRAALGDAEEAAS
jgi:homoprotocatechuate degradation regulator HpaR